MAIYGRFGSIDSTKTGRFDVPKQALVVCQLLDDSRSCQNWQRPRLLGCYCFWQLRLEVSYQKWQLPSSLYVARTGSDT